MDQSIEILVSNPSDKPNQLTVEKESVFGTFCEKSSSMLDSGMILARNETVCPVWGDVLGFKSTTLICPPEDYDSVVYWCEYVNGAGSVSKTKTLDDGRIALRSDYMCW